MNRSATLLFVIVSSGWLLPVCAENRIKGAELVKPGVNMGELMPDLLTFEVNKAELDLFAAHVGVMEQWAAGNPEQWMRVASTDDPIGEIMSWKDWWSSVDITAADTIAMLVKLNTAGQVAKDAFKQMPTSIRVYKARIANPKIPEKDKVNLRKTVARMQKIVDGVKAYPASNTVFYKQNEKAIAEVLSRFDRIHSTAGEKIAKKNPPAEEPAPGKGADDQASPAKAPVRKSRPVTPPKKPEKRRFSKPRPLPPVPSGEKPEAPGKQE